MGREEKALVWAGHVTTQNMDIFDSYSSSNDEIFLTKNYIQVFESQNTSQSILFMCSEVWHESAEIAEDSVDVF
jgi:hypothetical protein